MAQVEKDLVSRAGFKTSYLSNSGPTFFRGERVVEALNPIRVAMRASAFKLSKQAGSDIDQQCQDCGVEEISQDAVNRTDAAHGFRDEGYIRCLPRGSDHG